MNVNSISIVVPVYNEAECVKLFYQQIKESLDGTGLSVEILFVNDHSTDDTLQLLREIWQVDSRIKIISFSRNFGHQVAVTAGLHNASGDCVVVMDADLQDPPRIIPQLIDKWRQGFEVVYGVRRERRDVWWKSVACWLFYRFLHRIAFQGMPLDSGDFCLMDRRVVDCLKQFHEENPYVRGLRSWVGFKQAGVVYDRSPRAQGKSKYSLAGLFRLALSGIFSFSIMPLRAATIVGLFVSIGSVLYAIYLFIARILIAFGVLPREYNLPGWSTLACSILFLMGLQFIYLGILGEYVGRIFMQSKNRPLYIIDEKIGFDENNR